MAKIVLINKLFLDFCTPPIFAEYLITLDAISDNINMDTILRLLLFNQVSRSFLCLLNDNFKVPQSRIILHVFDAF